MKGSFFIGKSSSGRTNDSESFYRGSNPCFPANIMKVDNREFDNFETDEVITRLSAEAYNNSREKGFYTDMGDNPAEKIALMHSELSEILEAIRKVEPQQSAKCPELTEEEEEIADVFIRLFDYCGWRNIRAGFAITEKMKYNASRPYKHGKKF